MLEQDVFNKIGIASDKLQQGDLPVFSPFDGRLLALVQCDKPEQIEKKVIQAQQAFLEWRVVPVIKRKELVNLLVCELRQYKHELSYVLSRESGKLLDDSAVEVQKMIDFCDSFIGLPHQLYSSAITSTGLGSKTIEAWCPLGVLGVISASDFSAFIWIRNVVFAIVGGNSLVWKASAKTPITALACESLLAKAINKYRGSVPAGLFSIVLGGEKQSKQLACNKLIQLAEVTSQQNLDIGVGSTLNTAENLAVAQ